MGTELITAGLVVEDANLGAELRAALARLPVRVLPGGLEFPGWSDALRSLRQSRPDAVFLGVGPIAGRLDEVIPGIRDDGRGPFVVAVDSTPNPETIVAAMRAGASEFVFPPFAEHLPQAVDRVRRLALDSKRSSGRSRVLGFLSAKGGCGASTVACHVAIGIQRLTEDRILLADLDLEAGIIRFLLKTKSEYSVIDAVKSLDRLDMSLWKGFVSNGMPRLEVIGAPKTRSLSGVSQPYNFRDVLRFARFHYEWIVADLGRGITPAVDAALEEIDELYIVTTLDLLALYQAQQAVHALEAAGYERNRIRAVVNKASRGSEITKTDFEKSVGVPVYFTLPNGESAVLESYLRGSTVDQQSAVGTQFRSLAGKISGIADRPQAQRRRALFFW